MQKALNDPSKRRRRISKSEKGDGKEEQPNRKKRPLQ
jgi:hypothetical protein